MCVCAAGCGGHIHVCSHVLTTQGGRTALIRSAINGVADCVRVLVESGANKDVMDNVREIIARFEAFTASAIPRRHIFF